MLETAKVKIGIYDGGAENFFLEYPLDAKLSRSIKSAMATASFSISTSNYGQLPSYGYVDIDIEAAKELLIPGNMISLYLNDRKHFTGYITKIKYTGTRLQVEAKDIIWRLQNTEMNHMRKALNPNSKVDAIVKYALDSLKKLDSKGFPSEFDDQDWIASVTTIYTQASSLSKLTGKTSDADLTSDTSTIKDEDIKPKENETVYSFLKRLLKPWGYIIQATADGDLIIFRPNTQDSARHQFVSDRVGNKQYGKNVAPMANLPSLNWDISNLHTSFYVFNISVAKDKAAKRTSHQLELPSYEGPRCNAVSYDKDLKTNAACVKAAKRMVASELSSGWQYEFEANGFALDGIVFSNDIVIQIVDEHIGINEAVFVYAIEMNMSDGGKQITTFKCCKKEAMVLE